MARRRIGRECFRFSWQGRVGRSSPLDALSKLIDWSPVDAALKDINSAAKGEPAWPPLALFKAMLLAVWYDLPDVKLAEALDDRSSFRRFCGFALPEPTPERTASAAPALRPFSTASVSAGPGSNVCSPTAPATGCNSWTRQLSSTSSSRWSGAPAPSPGFKVLPRRWVVERSFGWMIRWRRVVRDYEQRIDVSEAMILVAIGGILLHRIAIRDFSNGL